MRRRDLLAAVGLAGLGGLVAGCSASGDPSATGSAKVTRTASSNSDGQPTALPTQADRSTAPSATGDADIVHGPRSVPAVALTFHGQGAPELTLAVLAACADAGAHITVFAVGMWVAAHRSLLESILTAGHELGNHTWSHQQMPTLSQGVADDEVARCAAALQAATGSAGRWFRPSGTHSSTPVIRAAAHKAGYQQCISYDVDPLDYRDPGAALIRTRTANQVQPGSILSLHLGHPGTAAALPGILTDLQARGLAPVTLSTLLGRQP